MTTPAPVIDRDAERPGVQILVDLWHVHTSEGDYLIAAATAELAKRFVVHHLISQGKPNAAFHAVNVASSAAVDAFLDDVGALLDIVPGSPIPFDKLREAGRLMSALRLSTYRLLTERHPSEATPLPAPTATAALEVPERFRLDWWRVRYMLRNLAWVAGWAAITAAPLLIGAGYWFGVVADWWAPLGWSEGSWWDNRGVIGKSVVVPVAAVSFVWALVWFAATHHALFARFNMWPDRGGRWERDAWRDD